MNYYFFLNFPAIRLTSGISVWYNIPAVSIASEQSADLHAAAEIGGRDAADLTDLQTMLLAENLSAFGSSSAVSEGMQFADITADTSALDLLLALLTAAGICLSYISIAPVMMRFRIVIT